jgi:hypothetical protein
LIVVASVVVVFDDEDQQTQSTKDSMLSMETKSIMDQFDDGVGIDWVPAILHCRGP